MMTRLIYFIILTMSLTFVFSQGKPCCKNKSGKEKVACKFNQSNTGNNTINTVAEGETKNIDEVQSQPINKKNCTSNTSSPWWKFWSKKKGCCNTKS